MHIYFRYVIIIVYKHKYNTPETSIRARILLVSWVLIYWYRFTHRSWTQFLNMQSVQLT